MENQLIKLNEKYMICPNTKENYLNFGYLNKVKGSDDDEGYLLTIKKEVLSRNDSNSLYKRKYDNELNLLKSVSNNPMFIQVKDTFSSKNFENVIFEKFEDNFEVYLASNKDIDENVSTVSDIITQLISIIERLLKLGVYIPNLNWYNLLVRIDSEKSSVKFLDFGISICLSNISLSQKRLGVPFSFPPEFFAKGKEKKLEKVFSWNLGILIYQLLFGAHPFGNNPVLIAKACKAISVKGQVIIDSLLQRSFELYVKNIIHMNKTVEDLYNIITDSMLISDDIKRESINNCINKVKTIISNKQVNIKKSSIDETISAKASISKYNYIFFRKRTRSTNSQGDKSK